MLLRIFPLFKPFLRCCWVGRDIFLTVLLSKYNKVRVSCVFFVTLTAPHIYGTEERCVQSRHFCGGFSKGVGVMVEMTAHVAPASCACTLLLRLCKQCLKSWAQRFNPQPYAELCSVRKELSSMPYFYDSGNGFTNDVAAGFSSNSSRIVPRPDADNLLVPTGYDFLDEVIGGYVRGGVTIVASSCGLGKTWLGLDAFFNMLEGYHGRAIYLSNEMTSLELANRLFGLVNDVPVGVHELSSFHESGELPALEAKFSDFCHRQVHFVGGYKTPLRMIEDMRLYGCEPTQALSEIIACMERESLKAPVDLFVVDNLHGIDNDLICKGYSWSEQLEFCVNALKSEAQEHNWTILLLAQLESPYEWGNQEEQMPTLSDIAASPYATNAADNVLMLYQDQSQVGYDRAASLRLVITKARYCRNPAAILNKPIKVARSPGSRFKFYV